MDFTYDVDNGPPRKSLGLVVLSADETMEDELRHVIDPDQAFTYVTRIESDAEVTPEKLEEMRDRLTGAAAMLPAPVDFEAVAYGCTSATSFIGAIEVADRIRAGCNTRVVTEPVSALLAACRHLGINRVAFLSPYIEEVSSRLRNVLKEQGLIIPAYGSFNEVEEAKVVRIANHSVVEAATQLASHEDAEAVFMSCTNLKTFGAAAEIERRTGKIALSSNLCVAWHLCHLAGIRVNHPQYGKLLSGTV